MRLCLVTQLWSRNFEPQSQVFREMESVLTVKCLILHTQQIAEILHQLQACLKIAMCYEIKSASRIWPSEIGKIEEKDVK